MTLLLRTALIAVSGWSFAACLAAPAFAQERGASISTVHIADATPGAVTSAVLHVPRPADAAAGAYSIAAADGITLFAAPEGALHVRRAAGLVPLTFTVPREAPAGVTHIARIVVRWDSGAEWTADLESRVLVRRGLSLRLDTTSVFVPRSASTHVGFELRNTGNAPDTVRLHYRKPGNWMIDDSGPLVVAAGATHVDSIRIFMPSDARDGETQIVRVAAEGAGAEAAVNLAVLVAEQIDDASGLIRMPATITLGAVDAGMLEETPLSLGLEMRGSLGGDTEASLLVRRTPDAATPPAFYRYFAGPSLRAELRQGDNRVTAGDVLNISSALHGSGLFGSGVDAAARLGPVRATVFAARPYQLDAPERPGHLFGTSAEVETTLGRIGVRASDLERPAGFMGETERARVAAITYRGTLTEGLTTRAEAGLMTLRDADGRTREGVAFDIESGLHRGRVGLQASMRRVPGSLATSGAAIDETWLSGTFDLGHGFDLNGWYSLSEASLLNGAGSSHEGAALGARWSGSGASAFMTAHLRETTGDGALTGGTEQRSIAVGGAAPIGPLHIDGTIEFGRANNRGVEQPLRHVTSRLSYQAAHAWAWFSVSHSDGIFGSDVTRTDAGTTVRAGRFEVDGRVGAWLNNASGARMDAWLSTTMNLDRRTAIIAGIDYAPWNMASGDVRVSLAIRHSIGVPLPLRRRPLVHGMIFEDRNGNLRRDAGEPGVPGVRVRRGNSVAVTDANGRYAFYAAAATGQVPIHIDAGSLGSGLMLPPDEARPGRGRVDVPVIRAAALRLYVSGVNGRDRAADTPRNGVPGAVIELTDADGRTRTAAADAGGNVRFAALAPGEYVARARASAAQHNNAGEPVRFVLVAGEEMRIELTAPVHTREVRFSMTADTTTSDTAHVDTAAGAAAGHAAEATGQDITRAPVPATTQPPRAARIEPQQSRPDGSAPAPATPDTAALPVPESVTDVAPARTGYGRMAGGAAGIALLAAGSAALLWWRRRRA